jgi:hypothetical protein
MLRPEGVLVLALTAMERVEAGTSLGIDNSQGISAAAAPSLYDGTAAGPHNSTCAWCALPPIFVPMSTSMHVPLRAGVIPAHVCSLTARATPFALHVRAQVVQVRFAHAPPSSTACPRTPRARRPLLARPGPTSHPPPPARPPSQPLDVLSAHVLGLPHQHDGRAHLRRPHRDPLHDVVLRRAVRRCHVLRMRLLPGLLLRPVYAMTSRPRPRHVCPLSLSLSDFVSLARRAEAVCPLGESSV